MSKVIDLRSDTVTRPVPEMREAIAKAVVGDDVFGDDPTVNTLEDKVAALFEKDAALFVPSGTMANQVALSSLAEPGDEIIMDRQAHVFNYEVAGIAALSGIQINPLDGERGVLTVEMIEPHIRADNIHHPRTRVISLENTHNRAGGHIYPLKEMQRIKAFAKDHDLKVHLDGARIANAVVATGNTFAQYADCVDTLSMCFSKGLGAPVGSIVVADKKTIEKARRRRKMLGGGMRQVGILASAASYALDHHIDRLKIDHDHARMLGEIIEETDGLSLAHPIDTNIVVFRVDKRLGTVEDVVAALKRENILAVPFGKDIIRMVPNLNISKEDIETAGNALLSLGSS